MRVMFYNSFGNLEIFMEKHIIISTIGFPLLIVIIISIISDFISNENITSKENIIDTVLVVDSYESSSGGVMTLVGKTPVYTPRTTHYITVVKYKEKKYKIDDYDTYKQFKNKKGQNVKATITKITYKDKKIKYEIKDLYEEKQEEKQ